MAKIHILDKQTVDQIAAGEVVERPMNVVKELIENSIDAGAKAVTLEIKDGGISLIRVTDDGCGIEKEDLNNAFLRHATSKISSAEDLYHIESLGFRGEALSSISAVSQVEMITKTRDSLGAVRIELWGDEQKSLTEVGAPDGTTIYVRNLFFNTPARKKFLKSATTEQGHIAELMEHLALSHPEISVKFISNGTTKFFTAGNGNIKEILYRLYGKEVSNSVIPIEYEDENITIKGYLGEPKLNKGNRSGELFFVNGRFVRSNELSKALEEGYLGFVMQHKFPFACIYIYTNPESLDVNIHPTKQEIRFEDGQAVFELLKNKVHDHLAGKELIREVTLETAKEERQRQTEERNELSQSFKSAPEPFETARRTEELVITKPQEENEPSKAERSIPIKEVESDNDFDFSISFDDDDESDENKFDGKTFSVVKEPQSNYLADKDALIIEDAKQLDFFEDKFLTKESSMEFNYIGQLFDTYWMISYKDKLYLIDQHAAHEKVNFERFWARYKANEIYSQNINPGIVVSLSGREEATLKKYWDYFIQMGFEIAEFGGNDIIISAIPLELYGVDEITFFRELLEEVMETVGNIKDPDIIRYKIASMSCKAAVKGNNKLSENEAKALIEELLGLDEPYHCPHGRPTMITMTKYEIDKKFRRIL